MPPATPILDRIFPFPAPARVASPARTLAGIVYALLLIAAPIVAAANGVISPIVFFSFACVVAIFAANRLSTIAHEAGHVVAALSCGYRILKFDAWPLYFERGANGLRFRWTPMHFTACAVGVPTSFERLRTTTILIHAAGGLANLLLGVASLALVILERPWIASLTPASSFAERGAALLLFWTMAFCFTAVLMGLVPFRRPSTSDAARIFDALVNNRRFVRYESILRVYETTTRGTLPSDQDPERFLAAVALDDGSREAMSAFTNAYAHFADGDAAKAAGYLESALRSSRYATVGERQALGIECAVFLGWYRGDGERARAWAEWAGLETVSVIQRGRARAVLLWCAGECDAAIAEVEALLASPELAASPNRVEYAGALGNWLRKMRERAR